MLSALHGAVLQAAGRLSVFNCCAMSRCWWAAAGNATLLIFMRPSRSFTTARIVELGIKLAILWSSASLVEQTIFLDQGLRRLALRLAVFRPTLARCPYLLQLRLNIDQFPDAVRLGLDSACLRSVLAFGLKKAGVLSNLCHRCCAPDELCPSGAVAEPSTAPATVMPYCCKNLSRNLRTRPNVRTSEICLRELHPAGRFSWQQPCAGCCRFHRAFDAPHCTAFQ